LLERRDLGRAEARELVLAIMDGQLTPAQVGAVLVALRMKGETVEEVVGAALAMRARATPVSTRRRPVIDTCGTGGDGSRSFNISTAAAFVVAAADVCVAKHGNRAVSSSCGSADVLEALGVRIDLGPAEVERCLEEAGIAFLFAPRYHPAMKHAAGPRREIGARTIFNLLGPLANPVGANRQLLGAYSVEAARLLAEALVQLGSERALVVHGHGGLDELALTGPSQVFEIRDGRLSAYELTPEEAGLKRRPTPRVEGGDAAENARLLGAVLAGEEGDPLDAVILNAGAALLVAGRVKRLEEGVAEARKLVRSGAASERLDRLRRLSQAGPKD
jgi:anthranilate phosphoribosyltransferase